MPTKRELAAPSTYLTMTAEQRKKAGAALMKALKAKGLRVREQAERAKGAIGTAYGWFRAASPMRPDQYEKLFSLLDAVIVGAKPPKDAAKNEDAEVPESGSIRAPVHGRRRALPTEDESAEAWRIVFADVLAGETTKLEQLNLFATMFGK